MEELELLEMLAEVGDIAEGKGQADVLEWAITTYKVVAANLNEKPKKPWE